MKKSIILFVLLLGAFLLALSQVPDVINIQGKLETEDEEPIEDGEHKFRFTFYVTATSTDPTLPYTFYSTVTTKKGLFSTNIGPFSGSVSFERQYWVGIAVDDGPELSERIMLTSVPYAYVAKTVEDGGITTDKLADYAVSTIKIQDEAIESYHIADGSITQDKIAANVSTNPLGPAGGDLDGFYPNPNIAENSIISEYIVNGQVKSEDIKNETIVNTDIAMTTILGGDFGNIAISTIEGVNIKSNTIDGNAGTLKHITKESIQGHGIDSDNSDIRIESITGHGANADYPDITPLSINEEDLEDASVKREKIAADAVTTDKIFDGQVKNDDIDTWAVTEDKIANNTVVRSLNGTQDDVTLVAGANISIEPNLDNDEIVISSTCCTVSTGGEAGGDLTGYYPNPEITSGAITENKLADGAVTEDKLSDGSVSQSKLADGVTAPPSGTAGGDLTGNYPGPTIATGAVNNDKLQDDAVSSSKIQELSIDTYHIIDEAITQDKIAADVSFQPSGNAGGDLSGTYPDPSIAMQAVTREKIAIGAVHSSELADNAVETDKIKDLAVTTGKIDNWAVTSNKIIDETVVRDLNGCQDNVELIAGANINISVNDLLDEITISSTCCTVSTGGEAGGDLTGYYPNPEITSGAVTEDKLSDGSVSQSKLADGVTAPPSGTAGGDLTGNYPGPTIATGAVNNDKLQDDAVSSSKIQELSIDTYHIIDEAITQDKIAADVSFQASGNAGGDLTGTYPDPEIALHAVTREKIAIGAVYSSELADNAVETDKIKDLAVTTGKIDNWAVTSNKIIDETVVRDLNGCQDNVELIAGANINISVNDLLDEITISSTCCEDEDLFPVDIEYDDPGPIIRLKNDEGPEIRLDPPSGRLIYLGTNGDDDVSGDVDDIILGDGITIRGTNGTVSLGRSGANPNNVYAPSGSAWISESDGDDEDDHGLVGIANRGHGVHGESIDGQGIHGESINNNGVCGESTNGHGVSGTVTGAGWGVHGEHTTGGTEFHGANNGWDDGPIPFPVSGLRGLNSEENGGWGLHGHDRHTGDNESGGVLGVSDDGIGVNGESINGHGVRGESVHGHGLHGESSGDGWGVHGEHTTGGTSFHGANNGWDEGPYPVSAVPISGLRGMSSEENGGWGLHGLDRNEGDNESGGVLGVSDDGVGVHGESDNGVGVRGVSLHGTAIEAESGAEGGENGGHAVDGIAYDPFFDVFRGTHMGCGTEFHGATCGDEDYPPAGVRGHSSTTVGGWGLHGEDDNENDEAESGGVLGRSLRECEPCASGRYVGVKGISVSGHGVDGESRDGQGVHGSSSTNNGVCGESETVDGVSGTAHGNGNGVTGSAEGSGCGVSGESSIGHGVCGTTDDPDHAGVHGEGPTGVWGESGSGCGVSGHSTSGHGVCGVSDDDDDHAGVHGRGPIGVSGEGGVRCGVEGTSTGSHGVCGTTDDPDHAGVHGEGPTGVWGESDTGHGLRGDSDSGHGVYGESTSGSGLCGHSSGGHGLRCSTDDSDSDAANGTHSISGTSFHGANDGDPAYPDCPTSGLRGESCTADGGWGLHGRDSHDGDGESGGVLGESSQGPGVRGTSVSDHGVEGESEDGQGVHGSSSTNNGVCGESGSGDGVSGTAHGNGNGLTGLAEGTGCGVSGHSSGGHGVCGHSDDEDSSGLSGSHGSCGTTFHGANCGGDSYPPSGGRGRSCDDEGGWGLHGEDSHSGGVTSGGVLGESTHGTGVRGICDEGPGLHGTSVHDDGGWGESTNGHGLRGDSEHGHGVHGESENGSGLWGSSVNSDGVHGESANGHGVCGYGSAADRCGVHGEHLGSGTSFHGANWGDPADPLCPPSGLRGSGSTEIGGWGLHGVDRNEDAAFTSGGVMAESVIGTGVSSHSQFGRAGYYWVDSFFDVFYAVNNGCGTEAHLGNCDSEDVPQSGVFGNNSPESGGYGVAGIDRCLSDAFTNAGLYGESQHNSGFGIIAENTGMGWAGLFNTSHPDGSPTQCYLGGSAGVAAKFYGAVEVKDSDAGAEGSLKIDGDCSIGGGGSANGNWTFNSTVQFNDDPTFGTDLNNVEVNVSGNVTIDGTLIATDKAFRIDHPLDPENKWLFHSCVESSERLNTYTGNIILDENGEAIVEFPDWFEAINTDFRYQLTAIGGASPTLHIAEKMKNNRFKIGGGCPGMEVSWQITCVRNDKYARENPFNVERNK
jgi:hypothetical protein